MLLPLPGVPTGHPAQGNPLGHSLSFIVYKNYYCICTHISPSIASHIFFFCFVCFVCLFNFMMHACWVTPSLQDRAALLLAPALLDHEGGTGSVLKDLLDTFLGLGRAFQVLESTNLLGNSLTLISSDGALGSTLELLNGLGVVSQIGLAADKDDRHTLAEVEDLRDPLLLHVVQGIGRINAEANENNTGVGVRKGTQAVVVFLASRIPESKLDTASVNFDIGNVVFKNSGEVNLGESSL